MSLFPKLMNELHAGEAFTLDLWAGTQNLISNMKSFP
jgi:hypothetical protein